MTMTDKMLYTLVGAESYTAWQVTALSSQYDELVH